MISDATSQSLGHTEAVRPTLLSQNIDFNFLNAKRSDQFAVSYGKLRMDISVLLLPTGFADPGSGIREGKNGCKLGSLSFASCSPSPHAALPFHRAANSPGINKKFLRQIRPRWQTVRSICFFFPQKRDGSSNWHWRWDPLVPTSSDYKCHCRKFCHM